MKELLIIYIVINLIVFALYGIDKNKAKRGAWRISEACLLWAAALMGGVGAWLGMNIFRHKTKHLRFKILVPLFTLIQIAVIAFYLFNALT